MFKSKNSFIHKLQMSFLVTLLVFSSMFTTFVPSAAVAAEEDTVYVSSGGVDTNAGTKDAPFATIEKALQEVENGGTVVLLSDFVLDQTLSIDNSSNILGKTATIRSDEGSTYSIIRKEDFNNQTLIQISNANNITFENLIIDGNNVELIRSSGNFGIYVLGGSTALFENVDIVNHIVQGTGSFVVFSSGSANVIIKDGTLIKENEIRGLIPTNPQVCLLLVREGF
ncbi:hypothetical protein [Bacillus sp. JCM 19034]|uniref:hypothetical protein n=1 Tax=Bacillus sp. JCM 19034 TaxID=1481928 RepID=UPI000784F7E0|nr:hypothetical protein [Bacillus sp. JCM 19034]